MQIDNYNQLPLNNQRPVSRLWVLNLVAKDKTDHSYLFQFTTVTTTQQAALIKALDFMQKSDAHLYEIGQANGGFTIACSVSFTLDKLKQLFGEVDQPAQTLSFVVATDPDTERKNKLISEIIEYKNRELLEANKQYLNEWDLSYIEEKLK